MTDSANIAEQLISYIGKENIHNLVHCATRLRFTLKNSNKVVDENIRSINGVLGVVRAGGQFQVIIGAGVVDVYNILAEHLGVGGGLMDAEDNTPKGKLSDRIFGYISGSFQPILAAVAGGGLLLGLSAMLATAGIISKESATYAVIYAMGNAVMHFMPILLGFTAAKHLKANPFIGAAIGGSIMHPMVQALVATEGVTHSFLKIPFVPLNYASSVVPILVGMAIYAPLELWLRRVVPKSMAIILVSLLSLVIMVPLILIVFGPVTTYLSTMVGLGIELVMQYAPPLAGALVGGTWFLLVMTGLHWGIIPLFYIQYADYGYTTLMVLPFAATMAQIGVSIAVVMRSKDKDFKALINPSIVVALLAGITEPLVYGVIMKYKRVIPVVIGVGALGGALFSTFQIKIVPAGMGGLLSFSGYINGFNSTLQIILVGALYIILPIIAIIATFLVGHESKKEGGTHNG